MLRELLKKHIKSQAAFVEVGFGQVEPNHLSAQRTGQIYAQLPAAPSIEVLEQGQFVKYDYKAGLVNFEGAGEWMLVYNETKLYREHQLDCEFAMIKGNYAARVYSPLDGEKAQELYGPTRLLQGRREAWNAETKTFDEIPEIEIYKDGKPTGEVADYAVASTVADYYELSDINSVDVNDPRSRLFMKLRDYEEKMMPKDTTMVPRVFKTNVGDIYTTNTINETAVAAGDFLYVGKKGLLGKAKVEAEEGFAGSGDMTWQVVKVYTMPDHQKGAKIMRIA
jgi:hypothetical protein